MGMKMVRGMPWISGMGLSEKSLTYINKNKLKMAPIEKSNVEMNDIITIGSR